MFLFNQELRINISISGLLLKWNWKLSELSFGSKLGLINIYSKINNCIDNEWVNISTLSNLILYKPVRSSDLVKKISNRVKIEEYWENWGVKWAQLNMWWNYFLPSWCSVSIFNIRIRFSNTKLLPDFTKIAHLSHPPPLTRLKKIACF